jgi:thiol-disulfide isomerase/thioredoxin
LNDGVTDSASDQVTKKQLVDQHGANEEKPLKSFSEIWPEQFLTKKVGLVDSSTIEKKHLALYFSAHWCHPCKLLTPKLSELVVDVLA